MAHFSTSHNDNFFSGSKGHYCDGYNPLPVRCDFGSFQDLPGQESCKRCERGTYMDEEESVGVEYFSTKIRQCKFCPNGYAAEDIGSRICTPCGAGFYKS